MFKDVWESQLCKKNSCGLHLGATQVLRNHFRGQGGQGKVLQLITLFKGGGSSQIITILQFLGRGQSGDCYI